MFRIFKSRTFRQGSIATAITALGVVVIIVLTMVLSALSTQLDWTLDLTPGRIFQISDETREFLEDLTVDVNIYVLNTEERFLAALGGGDWGDYMRQANEIIRRYGSLSPHVNVEYIDILANPAFVARHSDLDLRPSQILIESPHTGRTRVINHFDLFNIQTGRGVTSSRAEQVMTSAILNVVSERQIRVSVLGGYNNGDISAFTALLEANNYEIVHQNVMIEDIDPEATIAILVAPQRDLGEESLRRIDTFLSNDYQLGRTLFYVASFVQPPMSQMPNLSAWLEGWGIVIGDSMVFESVRLLQTGNPATIGYVALVNYAEDVFSAQMRPRQIYPAIAFARPISGQTRGAREVQTLLEFSPQSGVVPNPMPPGWGFPFPEEFQTGPQPALILSREIRHEGFERMTSQVLVSGSHDSFSSLFIEHASYANADYFLTVMNELAGREDTVRIRDRTISISIMAMTATQFYVISLVVFIVLPLSLLIFGIIVWWRRRHR